MTDNRYIDTRGASERPVSFTEAVVDGLAAGGGLYVPERVPELTLDEVCALAELPYAKRAAWIYRAFEVDLTDEQLEKITTEAYGSQFDDEAIAPSPRLATTSTCSSCGTARRALSRTWRFSACRASSA